MTHYMKTRKINGNLSIGCALDVLGKILLLQMNKTQALRVSLPETSPFTRCSLWQPRHLIKFQMWHECII